MKPGAYGKPKFWRLRERLGTCRAIGLLEVLWYEAAEQDPDRGVVRWAKVQERADDVDPDQALEALRDGWIEELPMGFVVVHDWAEHRPWYVNDRLQKRAARARKSETVRDGPGTSGDSQGASEEIGSSPTPTPTPTPCREPTRRPTSGKSDPALEETVTLCLADLSTTRTRLGLSSIRVNTAKKQREQVRTLIRNHGRHLGETLSLEDFVRLWTLVVHSKAKAWGDNPEMRENLRVSTLTRPVRFCEYAEPFLRD